MTDLPIGEPQECPNCASCKKVARDYMELNDKLRKANLQLQATVRESQRIINDVEKSLTKAKALSKIKIWG